MDLKICLLFISYSLALPIEDFDPNEVFLGHEREMETLDKVGQGVDAGPSDVGHELHAKMEEAAEKALAIIQHATKYLDESAKEQSSSPKDSYKTKDYKSSDWDRREKREAESVPQTDSDAAKTSTPIDWPSLIRFNFCYLSRIDQASHFDRHQF